MINQVISHKWSLLEDLPQNWEDLASTELPGLASIWRDRADELRNTSVFRQFMDEMRREIAIETGIIERLYHIDRGITRLLIENGIDEALIRRSSSGLPPGEIVALIRDQEFAVESVFDFVAGRRDLTTSYIRELHALLTRNQETTEALTPSTDKLVAIPLIRGEYKSQPNNPQRPDGSLHQYCPPEHVAAEMDRLVQLHASHRDIGVPPEIEAAWLHHAFTQIHPFQDGNGRVARCLASLVFIQEHWFPLTLRDEDRIRYIAALEEADKGGLLALVSLFAERQKQAFLRSLSLSERVSFDSRHVDPIIESVRGRIEEVQREERTQRIGRVEAFAGIFLDRTRERFAALGQKLKSEIGSVEPRFKTWVSGATSADGDRAQYHGIQIKETAKRLGYFANRQAYSAWVQLAIVLPATRTDILVSFHVVGHSNHGVYVASACAYHRDHDEEGETLIRQIEPLTESPFQFSYRDDESALSDRFSRWLQEIIAFGLSYWERGI